MALIPCPDCGTQISDQALRCTSCGALTAMGRTIAGATPGWKTALWVGVGLFVIAVIAVVIIDLLSAFSV